jgi:hypothetical protein
MSLPAISTDCTYLPTFWYWGDNQSPVTFFDGKGNAISSYSAGGYAVNAAMSPNGSYAVILSDSPSSGYSLPPCILGTRVRLAFTIRTRLWLLSL